MATTPFITDSRSQSRQALVFLPALPASFASDATIATSLALFPWISVDAQGSRGMGYCWYRYD